MVAETAAILLAENASLQAAQAWGPLLLDNRFILGWYAYLPDSIFRDEDGKDGKIEGPTHYFELDRFLKNGSGLSTIPRDSPRAHKYIESSLGQSAFSKSGSLPWRTGQFYRLAKEYLKAVKELPSADHDEKVGEMKGDVANIYRALYMLGVMSHLRKLLL